MKKVEIATGFTLTFTKSEIKELDAFLAENDYPKTKTGLKEYILDSLYEPRPKESLLSKVIYDNPDAIKQFGVLGLKIGEKILRSKFKI